VNYGKNAMPVDSRKQTAVWNIGLIKKNAERIAKLPISKTIVFAVSVILSGIFCGTFVTEITVDNSIQWSLFYKTSSFWIILVYLFFIYLYNIFIYKYETNMLNFLDDNYCSAYIIQRCLPELVEKYTSDLKAGKSPEDMIDIKKELKKFGKK
jgi:hypothetical protein